MQKAYTKLDSVTIHYNIAVCTHINMISILASYIGQY